MAEKIVNSGIVFAFATDNAVAELKAQLEKYFLYQTIVVFDSNFEYGIQTQALKSRSMCNIVVCHSVNEFFAVQNFDFAIVVNKDENGKIRQFCHAQNVPYMIVLTKAVTYSDICQHIYDKNLAKKTVNPPFGILLDKSLIFDKKHFQNLALLEISTLSYDIVEQKICNLFFSRQIDYVHLKDEQNLHNRLTQILSQNDYSIFCNFDEICNLYVTYCLTRIKDEVSVLDKLTHLFQNGSKQSSNKYIQTKFAYQNTLCVLEKQYFANFQNSKKSTINFAMHQKFATKNGYEARFETCNLSQNKTIFLFEEFRQKLIAYVDEQLEFLGILKSKLADFDIDFLYSIFSFQDKQRFKDMLSLEPDLFCEPSFLQIAYSQGLLNFEI